MAFIGKITATRGTLLRLRTNFKFVQNAMEILEMKRDRLATELNTLLSQLGIRGKLEEQLMGVFEDLKTAIAVLGYSKVSSEALSIPKMNVGVDSISIMGVAVPEIMITEKPRLDSIENMGLQEVAKKLQSLVDDLFKMGQIEADVERLAHELMAVNRKVNALEKVIVPTYEKQIRYIEDLLFDEELEDFARIKQIKAIIGREKA